MTYSYDPNLADDVSLVRFHIGDTDDAGHYLENETIQYHITAGSTSTAIINCIRYIITKLSSPDFKQDWLSVSNAEARKGYESLLATKKQELGIYMATPYTIITHAHRADSYENEDGEYTAPDGAP